MSLLSRIAAVLVVVLVSGCGMNFQTNRPYTPAEGVNLDVGAVHVRSLMILSKAAGEGILVSSMLAPDGDTLEGVTGAAIKPDGTEGAPFTASLPAPVELPPGKLVVLTDGPLITISDPDLVPGLTANLVLRFATAGEGMVIVPVVTADQPDYITITPKPST